MTKRHLIHTTFLSAVLASGLAMGLVSCSPAATNDAISTENQAEASNLSAVKQIYANFASGNIEGFMAALDPDMVWNEAENNLYAPDSPYVGVPAIMGGVFAPLGEQWDYFHVKRESYLADGDEVAMFGRYDAKYKATGKTMTPQIVHRWTFKDGKITAFQQHMDTLAQLEVLGMNNPAGN